MLWKNGDDNAESSTASEASIASIASEAYPDGCSSARETEWSIKTSSSVPRTWN